MVAKRIKYGRPVYSADRWHFHHRFADIGFSQRRTVLYLYGWTLSLAALALAMRFVPYSDDDGTLNPGWALVIAAFGLVAVAASVYLVVVLEILKFRRFREREIQRAGGDGRDAGADRGRDRARGRPRGRDRASSRPFAATEVRPGIRARECMAEPTEEIEQLLNYLLPSRSEMLEPSTASSTRTPRRSDADGEVQRGGAAAATSSPDVGELLLALHAELREQAAEGAIRASGIAADVTLTDPDSGETTDAVQLELDHADADAVDVYVPYTSRRRGHQVRRAGGRAGRAPVFAHAAS